MFGRTWSDLETIARASDGMVGQAAKDEASPYAAMKAAEKSADAAKEKECIGARRY